MPTDDLAFATIETLAPRIESGELSPVDLTQAQLDRIDRLEGGLKSYATVMAESALAEAERTAAEIADGQYRGPLHGIPLAVKDLCYTNGVRTMGGTAALKDFVPDFDSTVVARLRAAGAILLGKLNLTEGAMAGYNRAFAVPVNPWDAERWTGVSSERLGCRDVRGALLRVLGQRHGGLDSQPIRLVRDRWYQANLGPGQPLRSAGVGGVAGPCRSDDPLGLGRSRRVRGDRRG